MSTATASQHTATAPLRLTRRGRLLVLAVLVAVLFGAFSLGRSATQASSVAGDGAPAAQLTVVQPGESLWSVAQRIAPEHDPREVIAQIRRLNDLETSRLQVGQHLLLPTAA